MPLHLLRIPDHRYCKGISINLNEKEFRPFLLHVRTWAPARIGYNNCTAQRDSPSSMTNEHRLKDLLAQLYGEDRGGAVLGQLLQVIDRHKDSLPPGPAGLSQRDSLLITYPDQVQSDGAPPLQVLADFCRRYCTGILSGIHILPFYPWSSDDGFSVTDYRQVSSEYGTWGDIASLASSFRLMFDAVINHASVGSDWFQRMQSGDPAYRDFFISPPPGADLSRVVRPRALPLLTPFQTSRGVEQFWTTFSADQVDLNYKNPMLLLEIVDILLLYVESGAAFLRMDAIAYLWKEPGTACIHLPQTHALIKLFRAVLDRVAPHVSIITETNVPHAENISYFGNGTDEARLVYNFPLPPLLLHSFQTGSVKKLANWARSLELPSAEVTFFNFLASHDGIGLNPLRGILGESEVEAVVAGACAHGGLVSYKTGTAGDPQPYELNVNFFDALNSSDAGEPLALQVDRFLAAHAILLAMKGVPGIYFHSLFGSRGWPEGVAATGRSRTVNRQKLQRADLESELANPASRRARVFTRLSRLLQVRSGESAFHPFGAQQVVQAGASVFGLLRTSSGRDSRVLCLQNISRETQPLAAEVLDALDHGVPPRDILTGRDISRNSPLLLEPYGTLWLV